MNERARIQLDKQLEAIKSTTVLTEAPYEQATAWDGR